MRRQLDSFARSASSFRRREYQIVARRSSVRLLFISGFSGLAIPNPSPKFLKTNRVRRELVENWRLAGPLDSQPALVVGLKLSRGFEEPWAADAAEGR